MSHLLNKSGLENTVLTGLIYGPVAKGILPSIGMRVKSMNI